MYLKECSLQLVVSFPIPKIVSPSLKHGLLTTNTIYSAYLAPRTTSSEFALVFRLGNVFPNEETSLGAKGNYLSK